jgi:hypothetical protein
MSEEPIRSRLDRIDPDQRMRSRLQGLDSLGRRPWSTFLELLDVPRSAVEQLAGLPAQWARCEAVDDTASALASIGWPFFEMTPMDEAERAADLVRAGRLEEADDLLVESWNDGDALALRFSVQEVGKLYHLPGLERQPADRPDIGHQRALLIRQAWDCHVAGQYAAAITLTLAQFDGITRDIADQLFFSRQRNSTEPRADLTDEITLAGHPEALLAMARMMTEPCNTTEVSGRLLRHGIMHGRELGYGTLRNSTLALVTLRMLIVRMQPVADKLLAEEAQALRDQHRGSTARDSNGRRHDTEGFAEAKRRLWYLGIWQRKHYEEYGRYGDSLQAAAMGRPPLLDSFGNSHTRCTDDGQRYWAWTKVNPADADAGPGGEDGDAHGEEGGTVDGLSAPYYFGISSRDGERLDWRYAGDAAPEGPVAPADQHEPGDSGWYGELELGGSPDW